jgi:hypothetical protein
MGKASSFHNLFKDLPSRVPQCSAFWTQNQLLGFVELLRVGIID